MLTSSTTKTRSRSTTPTDLICTSISRRTGNRQIAVGVEDLYDMYLVGNPLFYPPPPGNEGDAHWIMYAEVPGIVLAAPLAPPRSSNPAKCRPIGLYAANKEMRTRYLSDSKEG